MKDNRKGIRVTPAMHQRLSVAKSKEAEGSLQDYTDKVLSAGLEAPNTREQEKARCMAWVQYARGQGEQDMRQLAHWINTDKLPVDMFDDAE